ncbi:MAG: GTP 3',8-cyclase MoaA [Elusimicrobia bacterium]|nr:GTP 3',8-cyclase MoaA [Elusimicrobiota bacterium]
MTDPFHRRIDYLRLSVTDRCNLRCLYCLPPQGFNGSPAAELLSDEEIARIVSIGIRLGIDKIRITGGEPLVRHGIVELVHELARLPGLKDISLSTNGVLLAELAKSLRAAGLSRVNVSLDTLNRDRFKRITRFGELDDALEGLQAALAAGLSPVKVNVVVMKNLNSDEIEDFVALARRLPVHVRFIELMPIGESGFFSKERWLPLEEIQKRCGVLEPLDDTASPKGFGPAVYYKSPGALGTIGFIGALSCNFCRRCNRLRLTSAGRLLPCLASEQGENLGRALRSGATDNDLAGIIRKTVHEKPEQHHMGPEQNKMREAFMCALGG